MDIKQSIEIMKALADISRLRVVNALMEKPQYVEELAHRLNLAASTISFHLKKLENAGLVKQRKEQYYIIYELDKTIFEMSLKELTDFEDIERFSHEERLESYRQKVLRTFIKKQKLVKLPVQKKKKLIILEEILKRFKPSKKYTEEEINKIIIPVYEDYCTIRRLMVDEGYMQRNKQFYWLNEKQ